MKVHVQFVRYGIVGLASNGMLYCGYLFLTWLGMEPKIAMSLLYALGIAQTFVFNRQWTFEHHGMVKRSLPRYVTTYVFGYLFQLVALVILVDEMGFPHRVIMAVLIVTTALLIFVLQKYWVFAYKPEVLTE